MTTDKKKGQIQKNQAEQYPRNAAETRQRILDAAKKLFSEDVYSKVGTRNIAAEAGVNLTLINRYFGSKKQLFEEVVMSLGPPPVSAERSKEQSLAAIMDFLSEDENQRKRELRLVILSALDSDVSDVVSDFFMQRSMAQAKLLHGEDKETKAILNFSTISGIALTSLLFRANDRKMLNKEYLKKHFSMILDAIYSDE